MNGYSSSTSHADKHISRAYHALKCIYVFVPIAAGADKFLNSLVIWEIYFRVWAQYLPMSLTSFMMMVGVIEIVAGLLVWRYTKIGAYVVMSWLLLIALTLIGQGIHFDIAVRDISMAVGAFALGELTEARGE